MADRLSRALVRGKRAQHWMIRGRELVYRTPDDLVEIAVPVEDLRDAERMRLHAKRLNGSAPVEALAELAQIAAGKQT